MSRPSVGSCQNDICVFFFFFLIDIHRDPVPPNRKGLTGMTKKQFDWERQNMFARARKQRMRNLADETEFLANDRAARWLARSDQGRSRGVLFGDPLPA